MVDNLTLVGVYLWEPKNNETSYALFNVEEPYGNVYVGSDELILTDNSDTGVDYAGFEALELLSPEDAKILLNMQQLLKVYDKAADIYGIMTP